MTRGLGDQYCFHIAEYWIFPQSFRARTMNKKRGIRGRDVWEVPVLVTKAECVGLGGWVGWRGLPFQIIVCMTLK